MPHSPTTSTQGHSGNTTIHVNQGENKGAINVYSNCNLNITNMTQSDGTQQAFVSLIEIEISDSDLKPIDNGSSPSLASLLNIYFTPLKSYESLAHQLYGLNLIEKTGDVNYPLWQIRHAYLATTQWHSNFKQALAAAEKSHTALQSEESLTPELAMARVLQHINQHPSESLRNYSGCRLSLQTLFNLLAETTGPNQATCLANALSLLITLGLRDRDEYTQREQILFLLKGEPIKLKAPNTNWVTTELKFKPRRVIRELMFIDFRYSCWSGLDLDGLKLSGADFTHAWFVNSRNLTEARYCCFDQINSTGMTPKQGADLKGTYPSKENDLKQDVSYYYFWGLSYLLQSAYSNNRAKRNEKLSKANSKLTYIQKYLKKDKGFMLKLHLATIAIQQRKPKKALNLLLTAWNLNADALNTLLNPEPDILPCHLNLLGWDAFKEKLKEVITQKQLRGFYTQLSGIPLAKHHTQNKAHKATQSHKRTLEYATSATEDSQRQNYLEFIQTLWPIETTLYEDLCHHPNPYGYRQSERIAYETLAASIQRLCLTPQSDDNKSLDTEPVNQDKALPSIEIRSLSVGNQRLLPSIVQKLIEHKLLNVNKGEFKPPQKKKTKKQTEAIKSQHRVICIDCDSHGVYISSEPDVPRHADPLEPGYVSIHLKIHPDLPMMDYTTDIFNRRLIGHGSPANEFVVLTITQETKDNKPAYSKRYPALISQTVEGINLKRILANPYPEQLKRLDNKSTSEFFIAEVLKHPGDGFSRNYIIKQRSSTTTQIVSVDNSQMFVEPIVKTPTHTRKKHKELQERSIIYCLSQITQTPLDTHALKTITAICDVTQLLTAWLKTVEAREAHYTAFLTKGDIEQWNEQREKNNPFIPHALFRTGAISLLAMQLRYLQSLFRFREQHSKKIIIKPTLVMNKLNPRLLKYYKTMSEESGHQALTSEAAFKKATGAVQSMSSSEATRAILGEVPDRASIQQQFNQRKDTAKMSSLVHKALEELNYLGEKLLADLKGKQAFNITDQGDWELRVDFQPPKKTSSKKLSSVRKRKHTNKAEAHNNNDKVKTQPVTAKLQKTVFEQKKWLDTFLVKKATFKTLVLSHCQGLDDARLIELIRDSQHLEYLDITGCQHITEKSLRALASYCKELRTLKASRTGIVDATRETGLFQSSRLLLFPKLNKLHLSDCSCKKVNRPILHLTRLALDAPELETLKINKNHYLRSVELPNSTKLTDLNLEEAVQLSQLNIPAEAKLITLNIAGCKQLTEEQLTFDSRLLSTLTIEDCDKLKEMIYYDFRKRYPSLLTALLWQHYTESFVETLSTTLLEALMAKGKATQWDKLPIKTRETLYKTLYEWAEFGKEVVPALLNALKDKDENVRQSTAKALAQCVEHDPSTVIPQLLKALNDKYSGSVREAAAKALAQCHALLGPFLESVIPQLLIALNDKDSGDSWRVRQAAAKALAQCVEHDPSTVIPQLLIALNDKDSGDSWKVRQAAAKALAQCHPQLGPFLESVIPQLLIALNDKDSGDSWRVRQAAAKALAQCHALLGPFLESVIPQLLIALNDDDSDVRQAAAKALAQCHPQLGPFLESVIPQLLIALNDKDSGDSWRVRQAAAKALAQCHALLGPFLESVIPQLLIALNDDDSDVRQAAAKALAQCVEHDPSTVIPQLLIALKDNDSWRVRQAAAQALVQCHPQLGPFLESVIPQLLIALNDKDSGDSWKVRQAAAKALAQCHALLGPFLESIIPQLLIALNYKYSGSVREAAAQALAQCHALLGPFLESIIPQLLKALNDKDSGDSWRVRQAAAKALAQCHPQLGPFLKSVIPQLLIALNDRDSGDSWKVRQAAAQALAQCVEHDPSTVIPQLLIALNDKDSGSVREAAAQALAQCHALLGPFLESVIPQLLIALNDDDSDVRQAAAKALAQCVEHDPSTVIPQLLIALNDKDSGDSWKVRQGAAQALAQCHTQLGPFLGSVIPELLKALKDKDSWGSWRVHQGAAQALAQCHALLEPFLESVIPQLLKALNDKDSRDSWSVREAAAQALAQCHALLEPFLESIIPQLLIALNDKDSWRVRQAAAQALAQCHALLGPFLESVIPQLLIALNDKDSWGSWDSWRVRQAAAKALGIIGSVDTLQSWIKNAFNEHKANLESKNTFEQPPPPDNATPYSSVITQQTSSPPTELPTPHSHSQNNSEEGEEHESAYSDNEI